MRIPKRFKLLGHTYEIKEEPEGMYEKGRFGATGYEQKWIKLTPSCPAHPVTDSSLEHTFLHELTHAILYHADAAVEQKDDTPLRNNEGFVDLFAGLLHQALTTMEYEGDECRNQ